MIFEFITSHWYLFALLFVIVLLLSLNPTAASGAKKISPLQLPQLQAREQAVVLDVGAADSFNKGHIAQSINLPLEQIKDKITKLNKYKNKPIIVACENGARSAKAAGILRVNQFDKLYILEGGLTAWRKENLPLVKR